MSDTNFTDRYRVVGMTCEHCVRAVTEEVAALDGVVSVQVELSDGSLVLQSEREVDRAAVIAAVDEAGYEVAS